MNPVIRLGDARDLPFKDNYFGLAFFSPPWDDLSIVDEVTPEIKRVLKKRGRWAVILPHKTDPKLAMVVVSDRNLTKRQAFTIPRPANQVGPRYFSVNEDVVHQVLDLVPWVRTVIDPFCGAGTIVKVARERGLEAYGVDIDPEAVAIAQEAV